MGITRRWLAVASLVLAGCSNSAGVADGAADANDAPTFCSGICSVQSVCMNGVRQNGRGSCATGTFVCETEACADDAGAAD